MSCSRISYCANKTNYGSPDMVSSAQKKNLDLFRSSATSQAPCLKNRSKFQRQFSGVDKMTTRGQSGKPFPNGFASQETCQPCATKGSTPVQTVSPELLNVCVVAPEPSCNSGPSPSCGQAISGVRSCNSSRSCNRARSCNSAQWKNPSQIIRVSPNIVTTNAGCRNGCTRNTAAVDACVKSRFSDGAASQGGHLIIGTCVLIPAIPDAFRPAGQGHVQQILAVVMYVTKDGYYKLGTRKGAIGKMFGRDEINLSMKTGLTLKDVPDKIINMREASSMSF